MRKIALIGLFLHIVKYLAVMHLMHTLQDCLQLKYLCLEDQSHEICLRWSGSCHLQQVCISSHCHRIDICTFMESLSAHGELECVVLSVESVTIKSITALINNSPNLHDLTTH